MPARDHLDARGEHLGPAQRAHRHPDIGVTAAGDTATVAVGVSARELDERQVRGLVIDLQAALAQIGGC